MGKLWILTSLQYNSHNLKFRIIYSKTRSSKTTKNKTNYGCSMALTVKHTRQNCSALRTFPVLFYDHFYCNDLNHKTVWPHVMWFAVTRGISLETPRYITFSVYYLCFMQFSFLPCLRFTFFYILSVLFRLIPFSSLLLTSFLRLLPILSAIFL